MLEVGWAKEYGLVAGNSEFCENAAYLVSAIVFTVGTVLFWPGIYGENESAAFTGEAIASWCFIYGSLGFVVASWLSSLNVSLAHYTEELKLPNARLIYTLSAWALFCSIIGGVYFVTGSWLYRPDLKNNCKSWEWLEDAKVKQAWCRSTLVSGTHLYIAGSCFYLAQSLLNIAKLKCRRSGVKAEWITGPESATGDEEKGSCTESDSDMMG